MKHTNKSICEAFANGATSGKANSLFIDGDVIYSYGRHFPLAVRVSPSFCWVNADKYSPTTSRHCSAMRYALRSAGGDYSDATTDELKAEIARKVP